MVIKGEKGDEPINKAKVGESKTAKPNTGTKTNAQNKQPDSQNQKAQEQPVSKDRPKSRLNRRQVNKNYIDENKIYSGRKRFRSRSRSCVPRKRRSRFMLMDFIEIY